MAQPQREGAHEQGFGSPNPRVGEARKLQQALELALADNKRLKTDNDKLRNALRQARPGVITKKHRLIIDRALGR